MPRLRGSRDSLQLRGIHAVISDNGMNGVAGKCGRQTRTQNRGPRSWHAIPVLSSPLTTIPGRLPHSHRTIDTEMAKVIRAAKRRRSGVKPSSSSGASQARGRREVRGDDPGRLRRPQGRGTTSPQPCSQRSCRRPVLNFAEFLPGSVVAHR